MGQRFGDRLFPTGEYFAEQELTNPNSGNYLEIGIFNGVSVANLAEKFPHKQFFGIDCFRSDGYPPWDVAYAGKEELNEQRQNAYANVEGLSNVVLIEDRTDNVYKNRLSELLDKNISVVVVDGSHWYKDVLNDIELALAVIGNKGGLIYFDDYLVPDVSRAVNEIMNRFGSRLVGKQGDDPDDYSIRVNPTSNICSVSVIASAVRRDRWMQMYNHIKSTNSIDFEFVFVGPHSPDFELPDNFRFIRSDVKPAQCFEIAARNARGHALLQCADDIDYDAGAIDLMYNAFSKDPERIMSTCNYWQGGIDYTTFQNLMGQSNPPGWPHLPVCGMYNREIYYRLGGADRRFNAVMWELDMYMRMWEAGIRTVVVDSICRELAHGPGMAGNNWGHDRPLILGIWEQTGDGGIRRTSPVLSYSNENILTVNQYA